MHVQTIVNGAWAMRVRPRCLEQDAAIISGSQLPQAELGGGEVIDAGFEIGEITANR